jgi:hypothetical protein
LYSYLISYFIFPVSPMHVTHTYTDGQEASLVCVLGRISGKA